MFRTFLFRAALGAASGLLAATCRANLDVSTLDPSVKPGTDFYAYVNGIWTRSTPVPPHLGELNARLELQEATANNLRLVCERASALDVQGNAYERIVGNFYASGIDEYQSDSATGAESLRFEFDRIDGLQTAADVFRELAHLQDIGVDAGIRFTSIIDPSDRSRRIAALEPGGLSLPSPGDYSPGIAARFGVRFDPALSAEFTAHMRRMFAQMGVGDAYADQATAAILRIETALAGARGTEAAKQSRVFSADELATLTPGLDWKAFFGETEAPPLSRMTVEDPKYFAVLARLLQSASVEDWRPYLGWRVLNAYAPYLNEAFVDEDFSFYGHVLQGAEAPAPSWRRVISAIQSSTGQALGMLYVDGFLSADAKPAAAAIADAVRAALRGRIESAQSLDGASRQRALDALDRLTVAVAAPDGRLDYGNLMIDRGPYVLNVLKYRAWEERSRLREIDQPVDRAVWTESPVSTQIRFDRARDRVVVPAGILQPPFIDTTADSAVNYGALGELIARAIVAGLFPAPPASTPAARASAAALADLRALDAAYDALEHTLGDSPRAPIDGFTPEQRFFLSFTSVHRWKARPAYLSHLELNPAFAPPSKRIDATLAAYPPFARAFPVPAGAPMSAQAGRRVQPW